jgi:fermentation-respiration switch protein FrsA (DUF1100 family)
MDKVKKLLKKQQKRALVAPPLLLSFCLLTACSSFFYYPSQMQFFSPEKVYLKQEDVFFKASTNDSIHAWWFAAKTAQVKGTVVLFHGNAENLTSHFLMLYWLPAEGYNYLIFDYPGFGLSTGRPDQNNTVAAGVAAIEWVHEHKDPSPLIVYGQSLGGAVALRSAEIVKDRVPLRNVIIDAGFRSYPQMARYALARSWLTWPLQPLTLFLVRNNGGVHDVSKFPPVPLLFIHGEEDNVIELENSQKLYALASQPKKLWIVPGGHHGDIYFIDQEKNREKLLQYLDETKSTAAKPEVKSDVKLPGVK